MRQLYIHCYARSGFSFRSKEGSATLDAYLSHKHDKLLAKLLQPDSYRKRSSLAIVDGFAVEITEAQVTACLSLKHPPFTTCMICCLVGLISRCCVNDHDIDNNGNKQWCRRAF
jgi:hypothetical protein